MPQSVYFLFSVVVAVQMLMVRLERRICVCALDAMRQIPHGLNALQQRLHVSLSDVVGLLLLAMLLECGLVCSHFGRHLGHGILLGLDDGRHGQVVSLVLLMQLLHGGLQLARGSLEGMDVPEVAAVGGAVIVKGIVHGMTGQDGCRLDSSRSRSRSMMLRLAQG